MAFGVGKRVVAESESTDRRPRSGVVEEVLRRDPAARYRIRWDDGHESIYTPASGALRGGRGSKRPKQAAPGKRSGRQDLNLRPPAPVARIGAAECAWPAWGEVGGRAASTADPIH